MRFHCIATKHNAPLDAALAHIDDVRYDMVVFTAASQSKFVFYRYGDHRVVPSFPLRCASDVLMCFHCIANEYNGPLEAAHAYMDDHRHDMVE